MAVNKATDDDFRRALQKYRDEARRLREIVNAIPEHRHNWVAIEWKYEAMLLHESESSYAYGEARDGHFTRKRVTKLYCPDCEQTKEVKV